MNGAFSADGNGKKQELPIGHKEIVEHGCPKCGGDLETRVGVCVVCVNFPEKCDYAFMSG